MLWSVLPLCYSQIPPIVLISIPGRAVIGLRLKPCQKPSIQAFLSAHLLEMKRIFSCFLYISNGAHRWGPLIYLLLILTVAKPYKPNLGIYLMSITVTADLRFPWVPGGHHWPEGLHLVSGHFKSQAIAGYAWASGVGFLSPLHQ